MKFLFNTPIEIANPSDMKFSSLQTMETLVAPIPVEAQKLALEGKSDNGTDNAKRPAPLTGGCRIEGYVRVKKVIFHWLKLIEALGMLARMKFVIPTELLDFFLCSQTISHAWKCDEKGEMKG